MAVILVEQVIEAAIASHLKTALHPVAVDVMPDKEKQPCYPNGAVLVSYASSRFGETKAMGDVVVQQETMSFDVTILARSLRDRLGIYPLMRGAKLALLGYRPPHCDALVLKNSQCLDREDMVWIWSLTFETTTLTVSDPGSETLPLLQRITLDNNLTESEEIT